MCMKRERGQKLSEGEEDAGEIGERVAWRRGRDYLGPHFGSTASGGQSTAVARIRIGHIKVQASSG